MLSAQPLSLAAGSENKGQSPVARHEEASKPAAQRPQTQPVPKPVEDRYVSKIGILTSSIPYYHNLYMEQQKRNKEDERKVRQRRDQGEPMEPHEAEYFLKLSLDTAHREQTPDEQAATARRLKPHSRSTVQLQYITSQPREKSEETRETATKKHRTKWQFGIRSRNLPHEAMHCVYKALAAHNAQWEVPEPPAPLPTQIPSTYPVKVTGGIEVNEFLAQGESPDRNKPASFNDNRQHHNDDYTHNSRAFDGTPDSRSAEGSGKNAKGRKHDPDDIDPRVIPENYIPKDPWCIKVRWRKDGMYPTGVTTSGSNHSSRLDLTSDATHRHSGIGGPSSAAASTTSVGTSVALGPADAACYVYMDVQLYTLEAGSEKVQATYLVDFKCAGYENLVEQAVDGVGKALIGSGYRVKSKDVTSPQPFLDLTNKLVIHLAGGRET